jgi:hypothetical protein
MMEDVNGLNEASQTLHDASNSPGHALIACPTTSCQTGYNAYSVIINRVNTSAEYLEFLMDGTVEDSVSATAAIRGFAQVRGHMKVQAGAVYKTVGSDYLPSL